MNRDNAQQFNVEPSMITRRQLLRGATAVAGGIAVPGGAGSIGTAAAAGTPKRVRLTLPAPTGRYEVGTVPLHLVDRARQDPWSTTPHPRELMVTVWYPARDLGRRRRAPWMPAGALAHYRPELADFLAFSPDTPPGAPPQRVDVSLNGVDFPVTHSWESAPVARSAGKYPVVLFSPGYGGDREHGTVLVEDLASRGYVVVSISHTYESAEVEFPNGRVELGRHGGNDLTRNSYVAVTIRQQDARFVINQLTAIERGHNPDAGHRLLSIGLRGSLDLDRIGIFGHSLGGATAAQTMAHDPRVIAGVNLDGTFVPDRSMPEPPFTDEDIKAFDQALVRFGGRIGNRPFMVLADSGLGPEDFGTGMSTVYRNLPGWRRFISLSGTTHGSYTDSETLFYQLANAGVIGPAAPWVGTMDPDRAVAAERNYLGAFFDRWLRHRPAPLLDGPSARYPEAKFY